VKNSFFFLRAPINADVSEYGVRYEILFLKFIFPTGKATDKKQLPDVPNQNSDHSGAVPEMNVRKK
jgi:hypothetical protein